MKTKPNIENNERNEKLFLLGLFIIFLSALQKFRVNIGPMPLYFAEGILALLIFKVPRKNNICWSKGATRILAITKFFFFFVVLGEIRGAVSYNIIFPGLYQIARYGLGICLVFALPRFVDTQERFKVVLKALVVGMIITGALSLFSSLPPTRPMAKSVFAKLNPTGDRMLAKRSEASAIRGTSLVGPPTVTGGYLCAMWPLGLLCYRRMASNKKWKRLAFLACVIAPIGALATYSRMAWLGVFVISGLIGIFGFAGRRRTIIFLVALIAIVVSQVGLYSKYFYVDRIERRTAATLDNPIGEGRERFLSYTEPFVHLFQNPTWFFIGAGTAGDKMEGRGQIRGKIYSRGELATHSAFAMAYYAYGLPGALCHLFLIFSALALILRNLKYTNRSNTEERLTWQTLLAVWCGLLPWWLFGHAASSTARGSMFFFFIIAIFLTCEQLRMKSQSGS